MLLHLLKRQFTNMAVKLFWVKIHGPLVASGFLPRASISVYHTQHLSLGRHSSFACAAELLRFLHWPALWSLDFLFQVSTTGFSAAAGFLYSGHRSRRGAFGSEGSAG